MRENEAESFAGGKENEGALSDWITGGPMGSKGAVLIFRSCVLASRTPSLESPVKSVGNNTAGTTMLLNKAKLMARRLTPEPNSLRPKNLMHDVMETFGNTTKYTGSAYVVQHRSTDSVSEESSDTREHKRDIDDVLKDLSKITLKRNLNVENTTAIIKEPEKPPPPPPEENKTPGKHKKAAGKSKNKKVLKVTINRPTVSLTDSEDSERLLIKEDSSEVAVLDAAKMPARVLRMTYRLINTETKLLHRLLQAHGMVEADPNSRHFSLMWAGLHPKPDVLRALTQSQRVNHFPRSYELTRKDKLFKNLEKMQYFRGLKHFDFIPTTFLMPNEYKELCTTHYRTKGPWIVKPYASSRGRGIYIVNTPDQIPKGDNVVVAKYVDKPLLIGGHKCDLRLYVCLTSIDPLLIYLYEEGLVRFATVKYDKTNKNLWNPCMHLCNYSINKYHTDYIKSEDANAGNIGHKWTVSALLRHLKKQGRNTAALMTAIEDLVIKSILSSAQTIAAASRAFVPHFNNCFELFGYDILVDDMLKPWLLEINLSPSLACESALDSKVKSALLADTLTLVGIPAVHTKVEMTQSQVNSLKAVDLKTRIGACRRVHSAENVCGRGSKACGGGGALTGEEARLVRAVKAQYLRRGGFVRIFPSQNSWQKYSQYLDPVSGIPVCSTSLNNGAPLSVVAHNYNLLIHSNVLPHFQNTAVCTDNLDRLQRYERAVIAGAAPAVSLGADAVLAAHSHDARRAKELVKQQLEKGMKLTRGEGRRAFGMFLSHVLKRIASGGGSGGGGVEAAAAHATLVHRFLKRATHSLRMPYHGLPAKISDKDRCAVVAKQLSDFLYMYHRETDLYTDSEDQDGCVSNIHFSQFMHSASEADLEDVLLLVLKTEQQVTTFLGDGRNPFCIDVPAERLTPQSPRQHLLLRQLACINSVNTRRYKPDAPMVCAQPEPAESNETSLSLSEQDVVKESLLEEKTLTMAMKYARS